MANKQARHLRRTMTPHEAKLWLRLRALRSEGFHFRRQVPIGPFIADFACLRHHLVVEVDGGGHARHYRARRDGERDQQLGGNGFRVLRFWNGDIERNLVGVFDAILEALDARGTPPTTLRVVPPPRIGARAGEG